MEDDLVVTVQRLGTIQNRYDVNHSDSTGTSLGDDGETADKGDYA
jgi:hypothetical protein